MSGRPEPQAKAATDAFLNYLMEEKVKYPSYKLELETETSRKNLIRLGEELENGKCHIGVVYGLEYGWLLDKHRDLEVLAIPVAIDWRCQLWVRKADKIGGLADLKGMRRAHFRDENYMSEMVLDELFKEQKLELKGFFKDGKSAPNCKMALSAVNKGDADCVLLEITIANFVQAHQESLLEDLEPIATTKSFPAPALIGRREQVDKLRKGMWDAIQRELLAVKSSKEGDRLAKFWRVDNFAKPDEKYLEQVRQSVQRFPFRTLDQK
jgi:ABC-type phosphate/phosphonate transport system substrate-binding protein